MALRDDAADEAFKALEALDEISDGAPQTFDQIRDGIGRARDHLHQIRLDMALAGAPIIVETPRGTIEVQAGLGSAGEAKA
jgi:hypothetical protein